MRNICPTAIYPPSYIVLIATKVFKWTTLKSSNCGVTADKLSKAVKDRDLRKKIKGNNVGNKEMLFVEKTYKESNKNKKTNNNRK